MKSNEGSELMQRTFQATAPSRLRPLLLTAQWIVAGVFILSGIAKLAIPIDQLSTVMAWTDDVPKLFVRFIGVVDILGGSAMLLPTLTKSWSRLVKVAALGCLSLQLVAAAYHASRGEYSVLPLNAILFALLVFILWVRRRLQA